MKRKWIPSILFIIALVLAVEFIVFVVIDACTYNETFSAPFMVYVLIRAIEFLLPSAIVFGISMLLFRKYKKQQAAQENKVIEN